MYCPRCDAPVPDGANFCMRCGNLMARQERSAQPAAAAAPMPAHMPQAPASVRSSTATPYVVMALIVAVVFLLGYGISNALQARGSTQDTLQAVQAHKPDLMTAAEVPAGMPPSVRDWLEHLRRIEEQKNKLEATQVADLKTFTTKFEALGPAAGLLTDPDQSDDDTNTDVAAPVKEKTTDFVKPWQDLITDYQSVPPPPECQKLADEYFSGLNEIPAEMNDVQKVMDNLNQAENSSDPSAGMKNVLEQAQGMKGQSYQDIDDHFNNSDELLGDVCGQYHTRKWFSITADNGTGLLGTPF